MNDILRTIALAVIVQLAFALPASAQTIGFAEAIDHVAAQYKRDIEKFCKAANLGGGRMLSCLNAPGVSGQCKASVTTVQALLVKRAEARKLIPRVCDAESRRLCTGVQPGDGNLMECFYNAKSNISQQCRQAVADAGYE